EPPRAAALGVPVAVGALRFALALTHHHRLELRLERRRLVVTHVVVHRRGVRLEAAAEVQTGCIEVAHGVASPPKFALFHPAPLAGASAPTVGASFFASSSADSGGSNNWQG